MVKETSLKDFAKRVADDEFHKVSEMVKDSVAHKDKGKPELRVQIMQILTPEVKQQYLDSFEGLSKEELKNKSKFFDSTITAIAKRVQKTMESGEKIDDVDSFVRKTLSNGDIYSKINKAVNNIENKDKNMNFDDPTKNMNRNDTDMNEEEKFAKEVERRKGKPTGVPETWTDEEKAKFEEEWKRRESGEEKYDPKTMDSWTDEEKAKFEEEWKRRKEQKGSEKEETSNNMEELAIALAEARRNYVKVHRNSEDIASRIVGFLDNVDVKQDEDVINMKKEYQDALESYRNATLTNLDSLSESEQKIALAELKSFDLNEKVALYDERVSVKAESMGGKIGKMAHNVILAYKKMPMKYKIAISGVLLAGGLATGAGVPAGLFGGLALGKRMLGASAAGVGATGWAEARAHNKEQASIQKELQTFKELSLEQQKAHLAGFDDQTFNQLNKEFQGKIAGRGRRVMLGIGATAGVMALGSAGKFFGGATEYVDNGVDASGMDAAEHALGGITEPTTSLETGGLVNSELIQKAGQETFGGEISFDTDLPEIPEIPGNPMVESAPAFELSDVSVEVKTGDNLWNIIKNQLETNNQLAGMTEDQKIMAIDELKDKFAELNPNQLKKIGFTSGNIDKIFPGNELNLTKILGSSESVQHALNTGKEFTGTLKHVSMEEIKAEMAQRAAATEAFNAPEASSGIDIETNPATEQVPNTNLLESQPGDKASAWINPDTGKEFVPTDGSAQPGDKASAWINPDTGKEFVPTDGSVTEQLSTLQETELISKLIQNPEFNAAVATQIKEITGIEDIQNIASTTMNDVINNSSSDVLNNVTDMTKRAFSAFGSAAEPKPGATLGSWTTRMFARAVQEGKVNDVFPSSNFSF